MGTTDRHPEILVTGIRVVDLFAPVLVGGTLAVAGDANSGVNVVAMELMQNLCRRYGATAAIHTAAHEPFTETNVRAWIERLQVARCVKDVTGGDRAEIHLNTDSRHIATLLPFAADAAGADAIVTVRRAVMERGRLPAVEVSESWSRLEDAQDGSLAAAARAALDAGNADLERYLGQPFFVAEPWTSKPGETTERAETLARVKQLVAG